MKVDFLIAGYQKCGTTALHSFLSSHPKVIGSSPKEVDFFNYKENYDKGNKYYHTYFKHKPLFSKYRGFKFMDASPSYVSDANVQLTVNRIKNYNNNIKVILLVRNPVNRAYSAWNMYRNRYLSGNKNWWIEWVESRTGNKVNALRRSEKEYENFTFFIENEIKNRQLNMPIECPILNHGHYFKGIEIFKNVMKDNLLVISNEEMNTNTSVELQKIANFLNLETYDWKQFDEKKVFKGVYEKEVPKEAIHILNNYYADSNKKLKHLTNILYK